MFLKQGLKWIILKEKSQRNFGVKKKRKIYVCPKCDKNSFVYVLCSWSEQLYCETTPKPGDKLFTCNRAHSCRDADR